MEADGDYQSITLHARSIVSASHAAQGGWRVDVSLGKQSSESKRSKWMAEEVGVGDDNIIMLSVIDIVFPSAP